MKIQDLMNLIARHEFDEHISKVVECELTPHKFEELIKRVPQSHYHVGHSCNNFEYERIILETINGDCFEAVPEEYNTSPAGGEPDVSVGFALKDCIEQPEINNVDRIVLYIVNHKDDNTHPNGYDYREIIIFEREKLFAQIN